MAWTEITRPKDQRDVINAIFYIARSGCRWRLLPKDYHHLLAVYLCQAGTPTPLVLLLSRPPRQINGLTRSAMRTSPQRLPPYHSFKGHNYGVVFLQQIGRLHVVIQGTSLELADPDPDQLPRDVVALGQRMQGFSGDKLLQPDV